MPFFHIVLFLLGTVSIKHVLEHRNSITQRAALCFSLFSLLFSVSLVLGYHIITGDSLYFGTAEQNYISSYGIIDLFALVLITIYIFSLALGVYLALEQLMRKHSDTYSLLHAESPNSTGRKSINLSSVKLKSMIIPALIIFIAYIPYFLVYCPGLEFGDSYHSLAQATGEEPWNNHHPVVYSFFIKCCLAVSNLLGLGMGGGRALYSIIQIVFMAICFAYMIRWVVTRCDLNKYWMGVLIVIFACTPYIASYSIAMWKDPAFSVSIMMLTLLIADLILTNGGIAKERSWLLLFAGFSLFSVFLRSNGIFVVALVGIVFLILFLERRRQSQKRAAQHSLPHDRPQSESKAYFRTSCISFAAVILCLIITGPIYSAIGIHAAPKVEGYGLFLNQMARVVVTDGSMSESDEAYMNEILPLDSYTELYTPCCIDQLKWSEGFNNQALDNDFFKHWTSMLIKNPMTFFEAWELETFGWWTVNQQSINVYSTNIASGVPGSYHNLLKYDGLQEALPLNTWSIPAGWILWFVLYLTAFLICQKKTKLAISLIPTLGLFITLLIASPICYWPRYAAAAQFLIPFYCALLVLGSRTKKESNLCSADL